MKITLLKPSNELNDIVKHYIIIDSLEVDEKLWILPNVGNFILFNQGLSALFDKYNSDEVLFSLPNDLTTAFKVSNILRLSVDEEDKMSYPLLGIELLPTGCHRLFSEKTVESKNVYTLLEECLKEKEVNFDTLYDCITIEDKIAYIEQGLRSLKQKAAAVHDSCITVENIIDYITKTLHKVNVSDILVKFNYSRTSLERDFKKIIGYTPKEFIQIMRFGLIFKDLMTDGYDFMELKYNYFDQSHMNKAFKKFIDIPPSKLQAYVNENNINIYQLCQVDG